MQRLKGHTNLGEAMHHLCASTRPRFGCANKSSPLNTLCSQSDIMQVNLLVVARTDSEAAKYLDNNADPRDHPFILGAWSIGGGQEQQVPQGCVHGGGYMVCVGWWGTMSAYEFGELPSAGYFPCRCGCSAGRRRQGQHVEPIGSE